MQYPNASHLIAADSLSIGYSHTVPTTTVASNLCAKLYSGELCCLLGANGTGKSTLIKTLCGFIPPLSGTVFILGKPIQEYHLKSLSRLVSVVLTDRIDVDHITVCDLVNLGRSPYTNLLGKMSTSDTDKVNESMKQCGIAHKSNNYLSDLSDGEQQKAFIAKALAQDTPIIILDEPTAFLDFPARVESLQLLRHIAITQQKAILLSTHDVELATLLADKLWVFDHTKKLHIGSPEDLIYSGSFNNLFSRTQIHFDIEKGIFSIDQILHKQVAIFGGNNAQITLFKRAFSRKGVEVIHSPSTYNSPYIKINNASPNPFVIISQNKELYKYHSIEATVQSIIPLLLP